MVEFLQGNSIWVYFIIFFGKISEVTCATLRIVFINKGEKTKGAMIGFIEVLLWVFITGTVLAGFTEAPIKALVFALAFSLGNYLGGWLEEKIALGLSTIQVIATDDDSKLIEVLRANGLGVTVISAEGKSGPKKILEMHLKRSRVPATVKLINKNIGTCVIKVSEVKMLKGGYISK